MPIHDLPKQQRLVFRIRYNGTPTPASALKQELAVCAAQPFIDNSGTRTYSPSYIAWTNIWDRYRVIKIRVTSTFYPAITSDPIFAVQYPYAVETSLVNDISALEGMPEAIIKPLPLYNSKPVVISKMYNLAELYKLYADNSENGLEGPMVWSNATH
jgi:hypothetical protein